MNVDHARNKKVWPKASIFSIISCQRLQSIHTVYIYIVHTYLYIFILLFVVQTVSIYIFNYIFNAELRGSKEGGGVIWFAVSLLPNMKNDLQIFTNLTLFISIYLAYFVHYSCNKFIYKVYCVLYKVCVLSELCTV